MKKILCLFVFPLFFLPACVMTQSPIQGTIFSDVKVPGDIDMQASMKMAEGKAVATGILGFVSGDCSYEAALKDALERSGARELKNIVVDHQVKNVLFIYAEYTTVVRGTPVK